MNNFTLPSGTRSCHNRVVQERPQSNTSLSAPASTSVLGPKRSGRGLGVPVPRSVTLKFSGVAGDAVEVCAEADAVSAIKQQMVRTTGLMAYLSALLHYVNTSRFESVKAIVVRGNAPSTPRVTAER